MADASSLRTRFEKLYKAVYGVTLPGQDVELVTWSVTVSSDPEPPARRSAVSRRATAAVHARRNVYEPALGRMTEFAVYQRNDLAPGDEFAGPALIEEAQTTTVVPASFAAYIETGGMIVLERKP
jgi:N-methylhydantoinase A